MAKNYIKLNVDNVGKIIGSVENNTVVQNSSNNTIQYYHADDIIDSTVTFRQPDGTVTTAHHLISSYDADGVIYESYDIPSDVLTFIMGSSAKCGVSINGWQVDRYGHRYISATTEFSLTVTYNSNVTATTDDSETDISNLWVVTNEITEALYNKAESSITVNSYALTDNITLTGEDIATGGVYGDTTIYASIAAIEALAVCDQTRLAANEAAITVNSDNITSNDTELADHEARIVVNEAGRVDHETRISAAESSILTHTSDISANTQDISDITDGTTVVLKAEQDDNGDDIHDTFVSVQDQLDILRNTARSYGSVDVATEDITDAILTAQVVSIKTSAPTNGDLVYDSDNHEWEYNGASWVDNGE